MIPVLGICLGMQLLFTRGEEGGDVEGLGLVEGTVRRLSDMGCLLRIPHVGWNNVNFDIDDPLLRKIESGADFYFVHSYAAMCAHPSNVLCSTEYGVDFCAAVRRSNVMGTQFHPEKSSLAGRQLLQNFLEWPLC
jgi:glutamine amidotransferase